MMDLLGLPALASEHGGRLDAMLLWMHVVIVILFIGWITFFTVALVKFQKKKNPVANYAGVHSHASTYHEIAIVVVEAVFLLGFSFPLWADRVRDFPPENEAIVVRVTGEQFAWNVRYSGPDGVFGNTKIELIDLSSNPLGLDKSDPHAVDDVVTLNQLHLPVNKPAIIQLTTKDVIHSFALQEMRIKQDAIPGMMIPLWFEPTVTTEEMRAQKGNPTFNYEIGCAQLCGLGHYRMRGFLTVHTPEAFEAWLASQAPS